MRLPFKGRKPLGIPRYNIKIDIMVWCIASGYGSVAGSCEHSPALVGCVKCDGFLVQLSDYHLINWNLIGFCYLFS